MESFRIQLKTIRKQRALSQEELAKRLGISRQALIALESGDSLPSLPVLMAILRHFNISFDTLFSSASWNPFRSISGGDLATDTNLAPVYGRESATIPVTLGQTADKIILEAEVPGVSEADLSVDLGQNHVVVLGIKRPNVSLDGLEIADDGFNRGPIARILSLPAPIDTAAAQASLRHGLLTLVLPKLHPTTERRVTFAPTHCDDNAKATKEDYGSK